MNSEKPVLRNQFSNQGKSSENMIKSPKFARKPPLWDRRENTNAN